MKQLLPDAVLACPVAAEQGIVVAVTRTRWSAG